MKNGAEAARIPPLKPFVKVSLITVVSNGPGLTPSTTPKVIPAKARPVLSLPPWLTTLVSE